MFLSPQIIELLILAGVAFFIINKLISKLGTTDDELQEQRSYFGEFNILQDVTNTGRSKKGPQIDNESYADEESIELNKLCVEENLVSIQKGFADIKNYIAFSETRFLSASKIAFQLIINAQIDDTVELSELIDQRYIEKYKSRSKDYGKIINLDKLNARFSDVYMFGNNIFIKLLFTGSGVLEKIENLNEEWTFSKRIDSNTPNWYLTNINS